VLRSDLPPQTDKHSEPASAAASACSHPKPGSRLGPSAFDFEVLTSAELAGRLKVKESWVVEASKRSRTNDPIPCIRLGKHRRYLWNSPEMLAWLDRRAGRASSSPTYCNSLPAILRFVARHQ
jgi:hypothetical protein